MSMSQMHRVVTSTSILGQETNDSIAVRKRWQEFWLITTLVDSNFG